MIRSMQTTAPKFSAAQQQMLDLAAAAKPQVAAKLLLELAATFWKTGQVAECVECFARSYRKEPCSKLKDILGPQADPAQVRRLTLTMIEYGCRYSDVIGELAAAEAALGHPDAVRRLVDYGRFYREGSCEPPPGTSLETFNRAVAEEVKAHLTFYPRADTAIRNTWRNNRAMRAETPALAALHSILARQVERYIAALPADQDHPFIASLPPEHDLGGWAVVSTPEGHHAPHTHPGSWANGVYYVSQPDISRGAQDRRGWLKVGPPPEFADHDAAVSGWETRFIEPKAGSFVLFPSYFFHSTEPMRVDQERVCIAFEIQPKEIGHVGPRIY